MIILFVCEGNMMRSQMAEAFYNLLSDTNDATSAGAIAETKNHISPRAVKAMDKIGIDTRPLLPKQLTPEMIEAADKVILFPSQFMPDYARDNDKSILWDVTDPHYHKDQGMDLVRKVRDDIRCKVQSLVEG